MDEHTPVENRWKTPVDQKFRFVVAAMQDVSWTEMVERWQRLDAMGLDGAMLADHFVNYEHPKGNWYEGWTMLAALAAVTKNIRVSILSSSPWRNPAFLARQAMTVDHISNGRLDLGLGAGAPGVLDPSYTMTGTPDYLPKERVDRFCEYIEIVDQLLRNSQVTFKGKYYQMNGTIMNPRPLQTPRPPIMVGGNGPRMLKIAARFADTWNTFGGLQVKTHKEMLELTRQRNQRLDEYCLEIGREPATLRRSVFIFTDEEYRQLYGVPGMFETIVKNYQVIGINEIIFIYPFVPEIMPMFEKIVYEAIPRLRE